MRKSLRVAIYGGCALMMAVLAGCGNSPPGAEAKQAITERVQAGRVDKFSVTVSLGGWSAKPGAADPKADLVSAWSAEVTVPEPYGYTLVEVDGKEIVRIAAKAGATLKLSGQVEATKSGANWRYEILSGDPWSGEGAVLGVPPGHDVIRGGNVGWAKDVPEGGLPLTALSRFRDAATEDSEEGRKLLASVDEMRKSAAAASAEQQKAALAAATQRKQESAEHKVQEADARRIKAVRPFLEPFRAAHGVIIYKTPGRALGMLITESQVDEEAGRVTGKGIDFREMPWRPFTFEGVVDASARHLSFTSSLSPEPVLFTTVVRGGLSAGDNGELATLEDADRSRLDAQQALGDKFAATPETLSVEILSAPDAETRQRGFQTEGLSGVVTHDGKKTASYPGLFSGKIDSRKVHQWKNSTLAIRLDNAVGGKGLYIEGATGASDAMVVVINGVDKVKIESIPKGGGALVAFPADLSVMDVRFEAQGNFQTHGIMLVK